MVQLAAGLLACSGGVVHDARPQPAPACAVAALPRLRALAVAVPHRLSLLLLLLVLIEVLGWQVAAGQLTAAPPPQLLVQSLQPPQGHLVMQVPLMLCSWCCPHALLQPAAPPAAVPAGDALCVIQQATPALRRWLQVELHFPLLLLGTQPA